MQKVHDSLWGRRDGLRLPKGKSVSSTTGGGGPLDFRGVSEMLVVFNSAIYDIRNAWW